MAVYTVTRGQRTYQIDTSGSAFRPARLGRPDPAAVQERVDQTFRPAPDDSWQTSALLAGIRIVPTVIGGIAGPLGAGAGAVLGETIAQNLEVLTDRREKVNPWSIAAASATSFLRPLRVAKGASTFIRAGTRAVEGAAHTGATTLAVEAAEGRGFQPGKAAKYAAAGGAFGTVIGGVEARLLRNAKAGAAPIRAADPLTATKAAIRADSRRVAQLRQNVARLERDVAAGQGTPNMPAYLAKQKDELAAAERSLLANRDQLRAIAPVQTPHQEVGPGADAQRAAQIAHFGHDKTARPADLAPMEVKAASYTHDQVVTTEEFMRHNPDVSDDFTTRFDEGSAARTSVERVNREYRHLDPSQRLLLQQVVKRNASLIDESARGRISDSTMEVLSRRWTAVTGKKLAQGEILAPEMVKAAKRDVGRLAEDVMKLTDQRALAEEAGLATEGLTRAIEQKHNDMGLLLNAVFQSKGEAARVVREGVGAVDDVTLAGRAATKLIRDAKRKGNPLNVTADHLTATMLLVKHAGKEGEAAKRAFMDILLDVTAPTPGQRLAAAIKSSLLLRLGTNLRNAESNLSQVVRQFLNLPFAVSADMARVARTGAPRERFLREYQGMWRGVIAGAMEGAEMVRAGLKHADFDNPQAVIKALTKQGTAKTVTELAAPMSALTFRNRALHTAAAPLRFSSQAMQHGDTFFRSINRQMRLHMMAEAEVIKRGLKGEAAQEAVEELLAHPTPAMTHVAETMAARGTFQEQVDMVTSGIQEMASKIRRQPGLMGLVGSMLVDSTLPFMSTPSNILRRNLLHTPGVGAIVQKLETARLLKAAAGGNKKLQEQMRTRISTELTAEQMFGVAAAGLIFAPLYASGKLTGSVPEDPIDRDAFYRQGKTPSSFLINNVWVKIANIAPSLVIPATIYADVASRIQKAKVEGDRPSPAALMAYAVWEGAWAGLDFSFLKGLSQLIETFGQRPDLNTPSKLKLTAGRIPAMLIPGVVGEVAGARDPIVREPKGFFDPIKQAIPGLRETLPPRLTARGEPAFKEALAPAPFSTFTPDTSRARPPDKLDATLEHLRAAGYSVGIASPRDNRSINIPDRVEKRWRRMKLSDEEGRALNAAQARFITLLQQRIVDMRGFASEPPDKQAKRLRAAQSDASTVVTNIAEAMIANRVPITEANVDHYLNQFIREKIR